MTRFLDRNPGVPGALATWWHGLDRDRGARAELRRCETPLEVMLTPAFHAARTRLVAVGLDDAHEPVRTRIAAVIGLLAHVQGEGGKSPAAAFSESQDGRPPVSPLRFRRILAAQDDTELYRLLRRVLPLAPTLNFLALASDVLDWSDATRKRWVYAYRWPAKQEA
ncbi:MAG TPA: type I-E CRISPR-associated protein Cse2/CasB [Rhodanobacteraceae bacterium]